MNLKTQIIQQIEDSIELKRFLQREPEILITIAGLLIKAFSRGNKVLLFGNGGSAADAQHIAAELVGRFYFDRDPLPVLALTTNSSILTSIGNDYEFDDIFVRQVTGFIKKGDIAIGMSTSGKSPNVVRALQEAKRLGALTIAFVGKCDFVKNIADHVISVPSTDTPRIQEAHILAGHIICFIIEHEMFKKSQ